MEKSHDGTGEVVLVVEDDFLVREFAADFLEESGFEVLRARDADEALAALEERPDVRVLFTDVNMPGRLDGIDLAREVARRWPEVSRLVTSGRIRPLQEGLGRFIGKPYRPEAVIATIRQLIRKN